MNTNLLNIVKQITAQYGENILADAARLKAFFSDLAKDEPKPLRIAFGRCIEEGAYNALKTAPDAAERASRKTAIAARVRDEHGLDVTLCGEALDILEAALFAEQPETPRCPSCGKDVDTAWKACPFCGTATSATPQAAPEPQQVPAVQTATAAPEPAPQPASSAPPPVPAKKHTARNVLIAAVVIGVVAYQGYQNLAEAEAEAIRIETARAEANMVRIPGGTFTRGSPANEAGRNGDEVQYQVTVSSFFMGKYEVTQKEWREVMGNNPSNWKGDNLPVENVSWYEAVEYCNKRSWREGLTPAYTINGTNVSWNWNANGYRLPTEAEWEYACRAGTSGPFNTGNNITTSQANYDGNYPYNNNAKGTYRERTVEVGSFAANGWGLYDMHGNVNEWCWDWYGNYFSGLQSDPIGPYTGALRVFRGGSWGNSAQALRSAIRISNTPSYRGNAVGFRLVRNANYANNRLRIRASGSSTLGVVSGERKFRGVTMVFVIVLGALIVLMVVVLICNVYHKWVNLNFRKKEPYTPLSNKAYYELFKCNTIKDPASNSYVPASVNDMNLLKEALKKAWECRNYEIDKFWSRSLFFWGFILAVFTGYIALITKEKSANFSGIKYLDFYLICLGFLFSLAWLLVLRGSKAWQENWETHIDRLEDFINGPLYKTVFCPIRPHFYSLAKINEVMAIVVIVLWTGLIVQYAATNGITLINPFSNWKDINIPISAAACATVIFSVILVFGYPVGDYRLPITAIQDKEVQDSKGAFLSRY